MNSIRNRICLKFRVVSSYIMKDFKCNWMSDSYKTCQAQELKKEFPNPREIVAGIMDPLTKLDPVQFEPKIHFEQSKYVRNWKCTLALRWPISFVIQGCGKDPNMVEEFCYLQACEMLKHLGLLNKNGDVMQHKKLILDLHDDVCENNIHNFKKMSLKFRSTRELINGRKIWTSSLDMEWPLEVHTQAIGSMQAVAEENAAALAVIKLKSSKLLKIESSKLVLRILKLPKAKCEDADHSYTIYVDASMKGYGAYLVSHLTADDSQNTIPWFSHPWDSPPIKPPLGLKFSNYIEYYAVLGAVFTWKHHFKDKRILVCSDNRQVVKMIQNGLSRSHLESAKYQCMHIALCYACLANRISLEVQHIHRYDNIAADYLSRQQLDLFHQLIPQAAKQMKKPKYLNFIRTFHPDAG